MEVNSIRGAKACLDTRAQSLAALDAAIDIDRRAWNSKWQVMESDSLGLLPATIDQMRVMWTQALAWNMSTPWLRPSGLPQGLIARVRITLLPTGEVVAAEISESSGNPTFDETVLIAVYLSSPVPLPVARSALVLFIEPFFTPS